MKHVLLGICMLLVSSAHAEEKAPALSDLAWIAGCWEGGESSKYAEQWMSPDGGTMLGMSRTVAGDKTVAFEFLRIHQEADGIYYTSIPSGQTLTSFKLIKFDAQSVVFENPDHDFPQRIIYRLDKDGGLMASNEGMSKGALQRADFPMRRATCK